MRAVEDFYGEMDFKVSGTKNGITAIQMDTKLDGLTFDIIKTALEMGKKARLEILDKINEAIPAVGPLSPHAPRVEILHIKPEEIGLLIGTGGKTINSIISKTGAQIDIEDDGTVMVSGTNSEGVDAAIASVQGMFKSFNVGDELTGKVVRLAPFGAFVEIAPGKDGLVHISQMAPTHVDRPEDIVSEGQEVKVRVTDVSPDGKIGLSMLFGADVKPETEGSPRPRFSEAGRPAAGGFRRGVFSREDRGESGSPRPRFGEAGRRPFEDRSRGGGFGDRPRFERRGGFGSPRFAGGAGSRGGPGRSGGFGSRGGRDRGGRGGFGR